MIRLQIFIILFAFGLQSYARDTVIKKITDDVITVTPGKKQLQSLGWPNDMINSVAIKTTEGIVLINTQNSPANANLIKNAVSEYFNDTVFTYIINNHGLSGHTGGNCVFTESNIIAHTNSTTEIRDYDELFLGQTVDFFRKKIAFNHNVLDTITVEGKMQDSLSSAVDLYKYYENDLINNYKVRFADITFDDKYELTVGNKDFLLQYMGKGHSASDIVVYIKQDKTLCIGNLFHIGAQTEENMPSFYIHKVNEIDYWISSLTKILQNPEIDIKHVITTHGKKPFTRENIEFINDYCIEVKKQVKLAKANNLSIDDIKNTQKFDSVFQKYPSIIKTNKRVEEIHNHNINIIWRYIE